MTFLPLILLSAIISPSATFTTFTTECTLPPMIASYVSAPNTRGSLEIVWSSLATIFICTYTVLHLNVPKDGTTVAQAFWKAVKWSTITILAPEVLLCMAILDFLKARKRLRDLHDSVPLSKPHWKLEHIFLVDMGGMYYCPEDTPVTLREKLSRRFRPKNVETPDSGRREGCLLTANVLCKAMEKGLLPVTSPISKDEMEDRAASDAFSKALTIVQLIYFCVNIITRGVRHLRISQLELAVTGFAACSIGTYAFAFFKPKGIKRRTLLVHGNRQTLDGIERIAGKPKQKKLQKYFRRATNVPNNPFKEWNSAWVLTSLISVPFGAIHMIAWDFDAFYFPTHMDKLIWIGASLTATTILPVGCAVASLLNSLTTKCRPSSRSSGVSPVAVRTMLFVLATTYACARLILMAEMIRCLFYLPEGAFRTTWSVNIPHIG